MTMGYGYGIYPFISTDGGLDLEEEPNEQQEKGEDAGVF